MTPRARRAFASLTALVAFASGCGGGPVRSPETPATPSEETKAPAPATEQPGGYAAPEQEEQAPPSTPAPSASASRPEGARPPTRPSQAPRFAEPPPAAPVGPATGNAEPAITRALGDLDRAENELGAAGSDCSLACKALGSMQRASERICSLEPDTGPMSRCRRARERVAGAQSRVRSGCRC